jgi:hypothetical protein
MAAFRGHVELVRFLIERGARPTPEAARWAKAHGYGDVVRLLETA